MKNTNTLYALGGLVVGILLTALAYTAMRPQANTDITMHQMPDGSMMKNMGSDMKSMMHDMNANLTGKTGDDFDKAFLAEMIVHHQGAIDMAELVLTSSKRPELQHLAKNIISAQTSEIKAMQDWQKAWFK